MVGEVIDSLRRSTAQLGGALDYHAFCIGSGQAVGGQPDLVALFVVITGVFGMAVGDLLFLRLSVRSGLAKGAGLGASSHGAGTAKAYEMGQQEGWYPAW